MMTRNSDPGPKRISYIQRREGLDVEAFRAHWRGTHSLIARDLPGVRAYVQNHVVRRFVIGAGERPRIDGMVELWFEDDAAAEAGFASDVADRLAVDELNFLQGLGGCAVRGDPLVGPAAAAATWLIADVVGGAGDGLAAEIAAVLGVPDRLIADNRALSDAKRLTRAPLLRLPVADIAIRVDARSATEAQGYADIMADSRVGESLLADVQLLVVEREEITALSRGRPARSAAT